MKKIALIINKKDNVATSLIFLKKGEQVFIQFADGDEDTSIVENDIPPFHKIALIDIQANTDIIKYGFSIGKSVYFIGRGEYVHSHNLISNQKKESCK